MLVGHGFRNFANYRLRLLLHCGVDWDNIRATPIRGWLPAQRRRAGQVRNGHTSANVNPVLLAQVRHNVRETSELGRVLPAGSRQSRALTHQAAQVHVRAAACAIQHHADQQSTTSRAAPFRI